MDSKAAGSSIALKGAPPTRLVAISSQLTIWPSHKYLLAHHP